MIRINKQFYCQTVLCFCLLFVQFIYAKGGLQAKLTASSCQGRIIVKYKESGKSISALTTRQTNRMRIASQGASVLHQRRLSNGAHLIQLNKQTVRRSDNEIIKQLNQDPDIEYAECDSRRKIRYLPNDFSYAEQWHLTNEPGGISAEQAWDSTLGNNDTVIAIIDTGIVRPLHIDLTAARVLAGYDFISADPGDTFLTANDGDGRDPNSSDPGDWVTQAEVDAGGVFSDCEVTDSSWHGTAIAGIVAAATDNNIGIAGIDHRARILPVRAIGKCAGVISDIAEAIRWAAGLSVTGVPDNADPADVINVSFGGVGACSETEQDAINAAVAAGSVVVVAAGNESSEISEIAPANCENVLVVTSSTKQGGETCYTNFGPAADIAAPGGNAADDADPDANCTGDISEMILTISNVGPTAPAADAYAYYAGSSFAAPMVAGAVALIKDVVPTYTNNQIETLLIGSAKPFPQNTVDSFADCNQQRCGSGIVDIRRALDVVLLEGGLDTTPDNFAFTVQTDVNANTAIESELASIGGINVMTPISVSNGEYSINNSDYTTEAGLIESGESVRVRVTSASSASTSRTATLNIGGVSAGFTVTTRAAASVIGGSGGDSSGGGSFGYLLSCGLLAFVWRRLLLRVSCRLLSYNPTFQVLIVSGE